MCEECCNDCECKEPAIDGTVPFMFLALVQVADESDEQTFLEAEAELGTEWGDGTPTLGFVPSHNDVSFPYYLGIDSDGDMFYRELSDFRWDRLRFI